MKIKLAAILTIIMVLCVSCDSNTMKIDKANFIMSNSFYLFKDIYSNLDYDLNSQYLYPYDSNNSAAIMLLDYDYLMGSSRDLTDSYFSDDMAIHDFDIYSLDIDTNTILNIKMRKNDAEDNKIEHYICEYKDKIIDYENLLSINKYTDFLSAIYDSEYLRSANEELGDMWMQLAFDYYLLYTEVEYQELSAIIEDSAMKDDTMYVFDQDTLSKVNISTLNENDFYVYAYLVGQPSKLSGLGSKLDYVEGFLIGME